VAYKPSPRPTFDGPAPSHLHHLEAADGRIYHYLQFASGKDTFLGKDSHFQAVEVTARVLPGQYLLVERVVLE
jgi:hypothetical protein